MPEEFFTDLAAVMDGSDEEIMSVLDKYDVEPSEVKGIFDMINAIKNEDQDAIDAAADADAAKNPISLDKVDAMADEAAKNMAAEDNTDVKVESEDKDSDGDSEKVTIEKETSEDDSKDTISEDDNSSEAEDKPHEEENKTNQFAKHLSNFRY